MMMEAVRTPETSVDNYFTLQYIPEDNSEQYIYIYIYIYTNKYTESYFCKLTYAYHNNIKFYISKQI
jgi:hypothetical protein